MSVKESIQKAHILAALIGIDILERHGKESPAVVIMAVVFAARALIEAIDMAREGID